MSDSKPTYITPNPQIAFTQVDEDIVLIGSQNNQYYGINFMGAEIWNLISSKKCTAKTICTHIMQLFEISEEQCLFDISKFLQEMHEEGFVTMTEA